MSPEADFDIEEAQLSEDDLADLEGAKSPDDNRRASSPESQRRIVDPRRAWKIEKFLTGDGKTKHKVKATPADWCANLVWLDGAPFSFKGREYLLPIYNSRHPRKLLLYGRQSEKTSALCNHLIVRSAIIPYNKSLYVAPSHSQARQFARSKLNPWIEDSPVLSKYWINSQTPSQIFERGFTNGSIIFLRSAFLNADRCRGVSADDLMIDELQGMLASNIPVILEVQSHSPSPSTVMAGTPLTQDNIIQTTWEDSSQNEWMIPCDRHLPVHWNLLGEKNIGLTGPICGKCGNKIDPSHGKWFSFSAKTDIEGFHISQLQVPWMNNNPEKWKEILYKHRTYSQAQFSQEVLGVYDSASKPITLGELMRICPPNIQYFEQPTPQTNSLTLFGGVDWGEGLDGTELSLNGRRKNASYTILTIGGFINANRFQIFFQRKYTGEMAVPRNCVKDILKQCISFNVQLLGSDWGFGFGTNDQLEEALGQNRVIKFQHCGFQRERNKYDPIGHKVQLNRTEVMTDFFDDLRMQRYLFPAWDQSQPFLKDVLNIHSEMNNRGMLIYNHKPSEPDDAAHSIIYCREAARYFYQDT